MQWCIAELNEVIPGAKIDADDCGAGYHSLEVRPMKSCVHDPCERPDATGGNYGSAGGKEVPTG
jgi:hypothetical protein